MIHSSAMAPVGWTWTKRGEEWISSTYQITESSASRQMCSLTEALMHACCAV